ncbi:recombinase RecT [Vulcanococcus sp.]|uniref:recombinase RecT n=1 Tax=Vulcanococcus sp. TaxID=2856995 RepID=UPI003C0AC90E
MASATWSAEHRALIKETIGKRLSNGTLRQLEHIALTRNLDPLCGELIAYEQGGKGVFITTIGGMTKLCAELLDGIDATFYDSEGNGHPVWLPDSPPAACAVTVYRRSCSRPFTNACRFADYRGNGQPWKSMPSTMIRKCALAGALRLAFADLLAGLYAQEEMEQAGFDAVPPAPKSAPLAKPPGLDDDGPKSRGTAAAARASDSADAAAESLAEAMGGSVLDQLRDAAPEEVAQPEPKTDTNALPAHNYSGQELHQRLYDRCRELGLTRQGLSTMLGQLNSEALSSLSPKVAQTVLLKLDGDKVAAFNSGLRTA